MAATNSVWGIDIGQCSLKAMRCTVDADGNVVADAFDFIEYPKILSQPEAEPEALIREALQQFLSRNDVKGSKVAISVAGQNGLARFFKPPPVDAKKIPDIVKYEARQQIPFALEDVIWDYQRMGGGAEVDGIALETEVGLFAMKRDQVFRSIEPFEKAGIELDYIQLAPLCIYNFVSHAVITDGPAPDEYDPDDPPESLVVLSVGTDTTDLVVTNGFRVWQRNIPLGGNHFTRQLTKDLKLTFAKAEHLKRNARQADDAKAVFQSMRPIFNDLLSEVQRSIQFFQSIDKTAKIRGVVMLGNAMKLPGLQQYLAKNLGYEIVDVDISTWKSRISGPTVLSAPSFKENVLAFGVCYGLCIQGLSQARLSTNLLPREILTQRLVKQKKPWAVAAVAALMLACLCNYYFHFNQWRKLQIDYSVGNVTWEQAIQQVDNAKTQSDDDQRLHQERADTISFLNAVGEEVAGNSDRRRLWLELFDAIAESMPISDGLQPGEFPDPTKIPYQKQKELHIVKIETQYFDQLQAWFTKPMQDLYAESLDAKEEPASPDPNQPDPNQLDALQQPNPDGTFGDPAAGAPTTVAGPNGAGWVIEIHGYHFHNSRDSLATSKGSHVRETLIKGLREGTVTVPGPDMQPMDFTTQELGIQFVLLLEDHEIEWGHEMPNPEYRGKTIEDAADSQDRRPRMLPAPRHRFTVQFCWQEKPLSTRLQTREEQRKLQQQQQQQQAVESTAGLVYPTPPVNGGGN